MMPDRHNGTDNRILHASPSLNLIPATLERILAELDSPQRLASLLDAHVDQGWPPGEYDRNAQEYFRDRLQEEGSAAIGWYGWYAVHHDESPSSPVLVAACGYFGPPNDQGSVEIGFSVMPQWCGQGIATAMARALVINAFSDSRVRLVTAHASPVNSASCKVLQNCGFRQILFDAESQYWLYETDRIL